MARALSASSRTPARLITIGALAWLTVLAAVVPGHAQPAPQPGPPPAPELGDGPPPAETSTDPATQRATGSDGLPVTGVATGQSGPDPTLAGAVALSSAQPNDPLVLRVSVGNGGTEATAPTSPVAVRIQGLPAGTEPAGATIARSTGSPPVSSGPVPPLTCLPEGATAVHCLLGGSLAAHDAFDVTITLALPATIGTATTLALTAALDAAGTGYPVDDALSFSVPVAAAGAPAHLLVELDAPATVVAGQLHGMAVRVTDLGPGAVDAATLVLRDLLPPGVTVWSGGGPGWTCDTAGGACSWSGSPLAAGAATSDLNLAFTAPRDLDRRAGGAPLSWSPQATATSGGAAVGGAVPASAGAVAAMPPDLKVRAATSAGLEWVQPPGRTGLDVTVDANGLGTNGDAVTLVVQLPNELAWIPPAGAAATGAWRCQRQGADVSCSVAGGLGVGESAALHLDVAVPTTTPAGTTVVTATATTANEDPSRAGDSRATAPVFVLPAPRARLAGTLDSPLPRPLAPAPSTDRLTLRPGTTAGFAVTVANRGSAAVPAGRPITVEQRYTTGLRVTANGSGWSCTSTDRTADQPADQIQTDRVSCVTALDRPLAPTEALPPIALVVSARPAAPLGSGSWDIALGAGDGVDAEPLTLPWTIDASRARPDPSFSVVNRPHVGGAGVLRLSVDNSGEDVARDVQVGLWQSAAIRLGDIAGDGWTCATAVVGSQATAGCTYRATIEPGASAPPLLLPVTVAAGLDPAVPLAFDAQATSNGLAPQASGRSHTTVVPLRPLVAEAGGDRTMVMVSSDGEATHRAPIDVLFDGRASGPSARTFRWHQRCTTDEEVRTDPDRCPTRHPVAGWVDSTGDGVVDVAGPTVLVHPPEVGGTTRLWFELTVTDGPTSATDTVALDLVVPTQLSTPAPPAPPPNPTTTTTTTTTAVAPTTTAPPSPGATAGPVAASRNHLVAAVPGGGLAQAGSEPPTSATTRPPGPTTTAPPPGPAPAPTTPPPAPPTTAAPAPAPPAAPPAALCRALDAVLVAKGTGVKGQAGPVSFTLGSARASSSTCDPALTISFSDARLGLSDTFTVTAGTGTISTAGLVITGGSVTAPASWRLPALTTAGELTVAFPDTGPAGITGKLTATAFPFVPPPSGWTSSLEIGLAPGPSGQSATITATAAKGADQARVTGTIVTGAASTLTVGLGTSFHGTAVALGGSVAVAADGAVTVTVTGRATGTVDLGGGVSLTDLTMSLSPAGLTAAGSLVVATGANPLRVPVSGAFTDTNNWSLQAGGTAGAGWPLIPGTLTVPLDSLTGSISSHAGTVALSMDNTAFTASPWTPAAGISVSSLNVGLRATCAPGCSATVNLAANLGLTVEGRAVGSASRLIGSVAVPSGATQLGVTVADVPFAGGQLVVVDTSFCLAHLVASCAAGAPPSPGLSVSLIGTADVLGVTGRAVVLFDPAGFLAAVSVPDWQPQIPGVSATLFTAPTVVYSSIARTAVSLPGIATPIPSVPARAVTLVAGFTMPELSVAPALTGLQGLVSAEIQPAATRFTLTAQLVVPGPLSLVGRPGEVQLSLVSVGVSLTVSPNTVNLSLFADATLAIPAAGQLQATALALRMSASLAVGPSGLTLSAQLALADPAGWRDAFGIDGLTLYSLTVGLSITLAGPVPVPGITLAARASLPASFSQPLGITAGTPIAVAVELDLDHPCVVLDIGDTNHSVTAVDLGDAHVLTATYGHLAIAPLGCTIGTESYQPGVAIDFDGALMGTTVDIAASVSIDPFRIDATVAIGAFDVGPLQIADTKLALAVDPSAGSYAFALAGGVSLFDTTITVTGSFASSGSSLRADLAGSVDRLPLGPVVLTSSVVSFALTDSPFSLAVGARSQIDVLGQPQAFDLALEVDDTAVKEASGDIDTSITVGPSTFTGRFSFTYLAGRSPTLSATVDIRIPGFTVTGATATLTGGSASFTGTVAAGGVVRATVSGQVVWAASGPDPPTITNRSGQTVPAEPGDVRFSASDVALTLGPFAARAENLVVGHVDGVVWGEVDRASVDLSLTAVSVGITISGSFDGAGMVDLTGTGTLTVAGFTLDGSMTARTGGGTVALTAQVSTSMMGSRADLVGSFTRSPDGTQFSFTGGLAVKVDGYDLGGASVSFGNAPGNTGFRARIDTTVGSIAVSGAISIVPSGRFWLATAAAIPRVVDRADLTITNCTDPSCDQGRATTLTVDFSASFGLPVSLGVTGAVSADGSFRMTIESPVGGGQYSTSSSEVHLAVVRLRGSLVYQFSVTISSGAPYVSASASGTASVQEQHWRLFHGWSGWSNLLSVGAGFSVNPWAAWISFRVIGIHVTIRF